FRRLDLDRPGLWAAVLAARGGGRLWRRSPPTPREKGDPGRGRGGRGRGRSLRAALALRTAHRSPAVSLGQAPRPTLGHPIRRPGRERLISPGRRGGAPAGGPEGAAGGRPSLRPRPGVHPRAGAAPRPGSFRGGAQARPARSTDRFGAEEAAEALGTLFLTWRAEPSSQAAPGSSAPT